MGKKTIRGSVYGIFPVIISLEDGTVSSVDDHWSWKYFDWVFNFLRFSIDFISEAMNTNALFPIKINEKDFFQMTEEEKNELQEKMTYNL